jgi:hypothetical protein
MNKHFQIYKRVAFTQEKQDVIKQVLENCVGLMIIFAGYCMIQIGS